jgi:hypothetical protein
MALAPEQPGLGTVLRPEIRVRADAIIRISGSNV